MFFRLLSPTVATLELICTTFEERAIRIIQTLLLGLFVERFQGGKQLIELLGGKAGEVVEVLGLAAEFLNSMHSSRSLPLPPQLRNGFNEEKAQPKADHRQATPNGRKSRLGCFDTRGRQKAWCERSDSPPLEKLLRWDDK